MVCLLLLCLPPRCFFIITEQLSLYWMAIYIAREAATQRQRHSQAAAAICTAGSFRQQPRAADTLGIIIFGRALQLATALASLYLSRYTVLPKREADIIIYCPAGFIIVR
jgi:hypothetical protein